IPPPPPARTKSRGSCINCQCRALLRHVIHRFRRALSTDLDSRQLVECLLAHLIAVLRDTESVAASLSNAAMARRRAFDVSVTSIAMLLAPGQHHIGHLLPANPSARARRVRYDQPLTSHTKPLLVSGSTAILLGWAHSRGELTLNTCAFW